MAGSTRRPLSILQSTPPLTERFSLLHRLGFSNAQMSIDLNWETLTSGPDGDALAERIRTFVHDKFQTVALPRFIRSVNVHGFDFGTIAPELELKDITDPLPDFYEQELDGDDSDDDDGHAEAAEREKLAIGLGARRRPSAGLRTALRSEIGGHPDMGSPFLGTSTPGILGGPGLNYFQSHLGTGTHTPLAAVAGAHLGNGSWMGSTLDSYAPASHSRQPSQSSILSVDNFAGGLDPQQSLREKSSVSTLAPTSVSTSRPPTRDPHFGESAVEDDDDDDEEAARADEGRAPAPLRREPRVEDAQAVFRIRYKGDIRLNLTAEILLDYPMPSFVGIPLKLNITGMSFDGVGVLAKIRKRVHFCFLSPEDALAAVGADEPAGAAAADGGGEQQATKQHRGRLGGLLQEIKVESEIGERDGGKQSLKHVGKVERFVLEQVRRIFEEEFVYPSFWTFLV
ncbi:Mitochondrial distribution and morphology protein 12 [Tolypocladium ophioglossoides CBS 100239]|uniref:Mitochondrial distribution and morphology protein 12 n=1 Tax=Tolypocladium ophioglossoides (strain CBS 100239) TaxID=1163406 RepID=A0A0L0NB56_TOLOC|nr:Mitochondrial distribution and morphology protein 12 [Tolypocladium ophioglossoides CBS 100239]